jgi:hypothetical protein
MIPLLIHLILAVIIIGVVFWAAGQLLPLMPMDPLFAKVAHVLLVLLAVIIVYYYVLMPILGMAGAGRL